MERNPITLEEERKVWTIHRSVKGLTYYYNRATKKSQYEMPECFKTTEETLEHPQWKEYKNADGKKFYYNSETHKSVWHLPNEVKQWRHKMEEARRLERLNKKDNDIDELLSVTDEQKKKFVALLREKNVNVNTKWDACQNLCGQDERWRVLKTSEKKNVFQDYIDELKKQEDNQKRQKLQNHKTNFLKMLMEHKTLNSDCKMHKMISEFAPDPRWRALDEVERENVYQMYMDELLNKEKEEAKIKKKECMDGLRRVMEEDNVSHRMKWDEFRQQYAQNEYFKGLHNYDRLTKFTQYILEQEKKWDQQQHREKQIRQRKNRDNFRQLLLKRMKAGQINHKSRWIKFLKENKDEKALIEMMDPNQYGSSAHELFEDLMDGIREYHKQFKTQIKQHFKSASFRMVAETTQQTFEQKLKDLDLYWTLKPVLRDYFYTYFRNKIRAKNKDGNKRGKKDKKLVFKVLKLKGFSDLKSRSQLSDFLPRIQEELNSYHLDRPIPEQTIAKYFNQFINDLDGDRKKKKNRSPSDSKSRSDSDSSDGERKKKKKRRKSSDSSQSLDKPVKRPNRQDTKEAPTRATPDKPSPPPPVKNRPSFDNEQQGEIKDQDLEGSYMPPRRAPRSSPKKSHKKKKDRRRSDSSQS